MEGSDHKIDLCRVLVVEDDPDVQQLVAMGLEREGFEFVTAAEADQARRLIDVEKFHVAVIDVKLPKGGDGFALADHLWRNTATGVLLVTGDHEKEGRLTECGHAYLLKPFLLAPFLETVREVMRATETRCRLRRAGDDLDTAM